jgi:hypothetical protein
VFGQVTGEDVLASLLPGLREIRTPLAVGYIWLLNLWLIFADILPRAAPRTGFVLAHRFELGGLLGRAAVLAALSFVGYILGSLLRLSVPVFVPFFPQDRRDNEVPAFRSWRRRIRNIPYLVNRSPESFNVALAELRNKLQSQSEYRASSSFQKLPGLLVMRWSTVG